MPNAEWDFARHGRLYPILDVDLSMSRGWTPVDLAEAFLDGGARLIQLRAKRLASGALLELAGRLVARAGPFGARIVVNDRADIARMAGAAGVHVGQEDVDAGAARAIVGPDAFVGLSAHTADQIEPALRQPISYLAVGPVFGTATKDTGYAPGGLDLVRHAAARAGSLPVVAIGGIDLARAPDVLAAGAAAVAVISDLLVDDPAARVRAYVSLLGAP
ncbi:MAG: thiamine phosphate synthase [Vicinamibacterales bacterium]